MGTKILDSIFRTFLLIILLLSVSCEDNIVEPPDNQQFSSVLKGKVTLENQTEHSNALVYIDSLNRGVSTDSSGNYTILFIFSAFQILFLLILNFFFICLKRELGGSYEKFYTNLFIFL